MSLRVNLDVDVLRSFVAGVELESFAKAADVLGRSPSAISTQMKKLEEQTGASIFRKSGRRLALTDAGEVMLAYARRMLDLNDEAVTALNGFEMQGWLRVGLQEDFGEILLPDLLGRFARAHPKVRMEVRIARNAELTSRLVGGELDVALIWGDGARAPHARSIANLPMLWIGPASGSLLGEAEPLPLVLFDAPCQFRNAATAALDRAGVAWRATFTCPSLGGLWAAAAAGLGVTIRTAYGLPANVRILKEAEGPFPSLPSIPLSLIFPDDSPNPLTQYLSDIVAEKLAATDGNSPGVPLAS